MEKENTTQQDGEEHQLVVFHLGDEAFGVDIGLALTRKLVDIQGGGVMIGKESGEWSNFTFTLPVGGIQ